MHLVVDANSSVPPFEQVRAQIVDLVARGELAPGTRLPPVRQLAAQLGIAANTVARSYRELEQQGVIETHGRNGTTVASHGDPIRRQAQEEAAAFAGRMTKLGLDPAEALKIVAAALGTPPHK